MRSTFSGPSLVVACLPFVLCLGFSGAIGETLTFKAQAQGKTVKPESCPENALVCTPCSIEGMGPCEYRFVRESAVGVPEACTGPNGRTTGGAYTAIVTFVLLDGSTLTLAESGLVCGPGLSLIAPGGQASFGNPVSGTGSWIVRSATGQFDRFTGSGTDEFLTAGADFGARYTGTLAR